MTTVTPSPSLLCTTHAFVPLKPFISNPSFSPHHQQFREARPVLAFTSRTTRSLQRKGFQGKPLKTLACKAARRKPTVSTTTSSSSSAAASVPNGNVRRLLQFVLWLAEAFLIPYMAIRLNDADAEDASGKPSQLGSVMTNGAPVVGLIGGGICLISAFWALFGRMDGNFGNLTDRWEFLLSYLGSERLAYAFIWDICLYIIFQPWLIGENLQNVQKGKVGIVNYLRFVPVVGLVAYLLCLDLEEEYY